ncbi:hypothetical protein IMW82_05880 [Rhodanobacter sp. B2A1Ga4]|uniref:hypothetical protein n=1 Tax=Rhodanobacter TaxID=75309 RepID=UPI000D39F530|nr:MULTISPECIES: hypothetical protein [Rhodanobacter]MBQ4854199.1 hypothetical protein [Rhodanobacter sp. B2A1Ga4]
MKPQELMTLALRVLAVFVASQAFEYLADAAAFVVMPMQNEVGMPFSIIAIISLFGPAFAAIVIWWCAPHLARLAARGISDEPVAHVNVQSVVNATFVAAGTLIFVFAFPALVATAIRAFGTPSLSIVASLVSSVLRCLLGVVLVFGSRATSKLLLRLRYAGTGGRSL